MNSINRRSVLLAGLGVAGAGALTACTNASGSGSSNALVTPSGSAVAAAEEKRKSTGRQQKVTLTAAPATIDLGGGVMAKTWAFDGRAPGKEIRLSVGDTLVAELSNQLPNKTTTSIHWHGIAMRNDMDGVPPTTQSAVRAGRHLHVQVHRRRARHVLLPPARRCPARPRPVRPADRRGPQGAAVVRRRVGRPPGRLGGRGHRHPRRGLRRARAGHGRHGHGGAAVPAPAAWRATT